MAPKHLRTGMYLYNSIFTAIAHKTTKNQCMFVDSNLPLCFGHTTTMYDRSKRNLNNKWNPNKLYRRQLRCCLQMGNYQNQLFQNYYSLNPILPPNSPSNNYALRLIKYFLSYTYTISSKMLYTFSQNIFCTSGLFGLEPPRSHFLAGQPKIHDALLCPMGVNARTGDTLCRVQ